MTTPVAISQNGMEHFEWGEQLYVLTAVPNLHKLYLTRQRLTSPACMYPCSWKELDQSHTKWVCISLHMANSDLNASENSHCHSPLSVKDW